MDADRASALGQIHLERGRRARLGRLHGGRTFAESDGIEKVENAYLFRFRLVPPIDAAVDQPLINHRNRTKYPDSLMKIERRSRGRREGIEPPKEGQVQPIALEQIKGLYQ